MRLAALALGAVLAVPAAHAAGWRTSWDGTFYGSAGDTVLRADSVLNPGNQVAQLPTRNEVAELRLDFKAESEDLRLTARPILGVREASNAEGSERQGEAYMSQWQIRLRAADGWNVAAGREVLNWGAAQFRSPSSPFYFDNGRDDPTRELVGMDDLKLSWTPDMQTSVTVARVVRSGDPASQPDPWRDTWLTKYERRGGDWAVGAVAAKAPHLGAFYGAHGQATVSDAWLLYGEAGSFAPPQALRSPADVTQPFTVEASAPRSTTELIGASYTFEDGKSLAGEYLHEGGGYTAAEESAYFQRAPASQGQALGLAPRLLGRDYLHLVWQSNLMDQQGYWRLMFSHSFTDGGNQLAAYGERVLSGKLSAYLLAVLPQGTAAQEFSALMQRSLILGLKIALP